MDPIIVFDFNQEVSSSQWRILDDVVMGGRSNGAFTINEQGHGQFYGRVSLENNGGFSSVRHRTSLNNIDPQSTVVIKLKGDGKNYQFRIKQDSRAYYSYIFPFQTSGEWETIRIPLNKMYPTFRGMRLNGSNFSHNSIAEVTFLIGNKKAESFELLIDRISLE